MTDTLFGLRRLMAQNGLDAYVLPGSDPHQGEYLPEFWQRRKFLSGFTGSAGDIVVTRTMAGLWTDSRYHLQAGHQLDPKAFTLFKWGLPGVPSWQDWVACELKKGGTLGVDPRLLTHRQFVQLEHDLRERGRRLKAIPQNLVDQLWKDRPRPPGGPIEVQPLRQAGETVASKLKRLRGKMKEAGVDVHVLSQLDAVAWLFNIRGSDVPFNPVVIAYALVTLRTATLFVDPEKAPPRARDALRGLAKFEDYDRFGRELDRLSRRGLRVWADDASACRWITAKLGPRTKWHFRPSPVGLFKAVKNPVEIRRAREAHLADGAALVSFLCWLEKAVAREKITELSAERKLLELRGNNRSFRGPSFRTISAYGPHGAIVHYAADEKSDAPLKRNGFYLIDSGGQYPGATTDITRTVSLGRPQPEEREAFSRVLKGLIDLSQTSFPAGVAGRQLDVIARLALWDRGWNYGHGTGHGVGANLCVHEGPQALSPTRCQGAPLLAGMITSLEPGYYREGRFGVRLENLVLVVKDESRSSASADYLCFETLSLCPIDSAAVERSLLSPGEITWLNAYHARVRKELTPLLGRSQAEWLKKSTRPL